MSSTKILLGKRVPRRVLPSNNENKVTEASEVSEKRVVVIEKAKENDESNVLEEAFDSLKLKREEQSRTRIIVIDDEEYVEEEIDGDLPIIDVARNYTPKGWITTFNNADEELEVISNNIYRRREKGEIVIPHNMDLFRAFHLTPLEKVKVVVVGQDPYHQVDSEGHTTAMGLSFSVRDGDKIPGSLRNIFDEIARTHPDYEIPETGNLSNWAKQGVLLLNICLTVPAGVPNGHGKYRVWLPFIIKVFKDIGKWNKDCIYVLWGAESRKIKEYLPKGAITLESSHPSPLGFKSTTNPFCGNGHFDQIDKKLEELGQEPIKW